MKISCIKIWALLVIFIYVSMFSFGQGDSVKGDVTSDSMVDGRDSLKIMRAVEGFETLTEAEQEAGDVYPAPGTEGRIMGDGAITEDDALRILYKAVGLIPEGEITGDYSDSAPRILDFSPKSGPIGTEVTIVGQNFVAAWSGENAVFFGDVQAATQSITGTRIVTFVPEGASTGLIRVHTPGGSASSGGEFIVTVQTEGVLTLPGGLSPADYVVVNIYGETDADPSTGKFFLPLPTDRIAIVGAVPRGEGNNSFLALYIPSQGGGKALTDSPLVLDSLATAKTLIFLHPYFMTNDLSATNFLMTQIETITEVQDLADVISQRYPQGANGLEDSQVLDAWGNAVKAVIDALPGAYTYLITNPPKTKRIQNSKFKIQNSIPRQQISQNGNDVDVHIYAMDQDYVYFRYDEENHSVVPYRYQDYSPVDWLLCMYRIDPADMPKGVGESYFTLYKRNLKRLGYEKSSMIEANLWTAKIDIVGAGLGFALDGMFDFVGMGGGDEGIPLQDMTDGIYMIRAYSGVYKDRWEFLGDDLEGVRNFHRGPEMAKYATGINAVLALLDAWSLVAGEENSFTREAIKTGFQSGIDEFAHQVGNNVLGDLSTKEALGVLLDVIIAAGQGIVEMSAGEGVSQAMEKLQKTCFSALKSAHFLIKIMEKISTLGRIAERITGLLGYIINPLGLDIPAGPTPLETTLVMVGYPFDPVIDSFTPTSGGAGAQITITGKNFAAEAEDNTVKFDNIEAKVVSTDGRTKLVVEVPKGLSSGKTISITVKTPPASMSKHGFKVTAIPLIDKITPTVGYGPSFNPAGKPYENYPGTLVQFIGKDMLPEADRDAHKVFFDSTEVPIFSQNDNTITVYPPALSQGDHDVYIRFMRSDLTTWAETERFNFYFFGKPGISSVKPTTASPGELIEIRGGGLLESQLEVGGVIATRKQIAGSIDLYAIMPTVGDPGDSLPLVVWNPAGSTSAGSITRNPGITIPPLDTMSNGFSIPIQTTDTTDAVDGIITIDEACRFARGENPFDTYDDRNQKWTHHWHEKKNPDDTYYWEENPSEFVKETLNQNNGPDHETREHYRIDHYHVDHGGGQSDPYYQSSEDLDTGADDEHKVEEGDHLTALSGAPTDYLNYNGANYKDTITRSTPGGTYQASSLLIGKQDTINLADTTVTLLGTLNMQEGAQYTFGTLKTNSVIQANTSHLQIVGTIQGAINMQNGFNNRIQNVTIQNAGNYGINMKSCGKNTINVTINNVTGDGVIMDDSDENNITLTVSTCGGDGLSLSECSNNTLNVNNIEDCDGYGVLVSGGTLNSLSVGAIARCQIGIYLSGTKQSNIYGNAYIHHCTGNGITIEGGMNHSLQVKSRDNDGHGIELIETSLNTILNSDFAGNKKNGIVVNGSESVFNSIHSCQIGRYSSSGYIISGNSGHGIHVSEGANHNALGGGNYITSNGGHGIFIEGTGSSNNIR